MNMYLAQSEATIAECKYLVSTKANLTSSQDSKPLLGIKQDAMTGGYKLTWGTIKINKEVFMDCLTTTYFSQKYIQYKFKHIKKVLRSTLPKTTSLLKTEIIEELRMLKQEKSTQVSRINELKLALSNEIRQLEEAAFQRVVYTGHNLFSFLLPDDFDYTCQNKLSPDGKPVCIKRGVLVSGTLSKDAIGSSSGSLIHHLFKDYGRDIAADFISRYQVLINTWLQHNGFSVGIEDCIPKKTDVIINEVEKCYLEASAFIQIEHDPELLEQKISVTLNKAQSIGQKIAKDSLVSTNNLVSMVSSGSKGSYANITQVTGVVGQQNVQAKRIQKTFGGRTIPYFPHTNNNSDIPQGVDTTDLKVLHNVFASRGFVSSSFYKGLNMKEFMFLAAGGREGLIDTAVKSVTWETEIIIIENNKAKHLCIGEWIDNMLDDKQNAKKIEHHLEANMELLNIPKGTVYMPTCDSSGKTSWGELTAVTRHDPGDVLYKIETEGGRDVIVTASKSLIVWDGKEFTPRLTKDVKVGDGLPVTWNLSAPPIVKNFVDMTEYLPKTKYIYGTDFHIAVKMMQETMTSELSEGGQAYLKSKARPTVSDHSPQEQEPQVELKRTKVPKGWWESVNGKQFTVPYPKKAQLQRTMIRSKIENIRPGYIYPYDANREDRLIPEKFPLTLENGQFIGLFLADGNVDIHDNATIKITKNSPSVIKFVREWFAKHNIKSRVEVKKVEATETKIGGTSTMTSGTSSVLAQFLLKFVGHTSYNKFVPNEAYTAPEEFIIGLLSGYFSGDGTVSQNSISCTSVSEKLINGIIQCCSRLGIFCKKYKRQQEFNNLGTQNIAPAYSIDIRSEYLKKFKEKISLIEADKNKKLKTATYSNEYKNFPKTEQVILDKIKSITEVDPSKYPKMYDVTIPDTLILGLANSLNVNDTADTGYVQRRTIKLLEDLKFTYLGTVVNSNNTILDFMYGADLFDAAELIKTKHGYSYIDINHVVNKLNSDYELQSKSLLRV